MEGKELADAAIGWGDILKTVLALAVGGGLTAGTWRIVKMSSSKDQEINKSYNRALEEKIKSAEKIAETNHQNLKEDVGELKSELSQVLSGMSDLTIELRSSAEINKAVISSNTKLMESKDKEVDALKKSISQRDIQIELEKERGVSDHEEWKQKLKEISEGVVNMLDDPDIKKHLDKMGIDLNKRMDEVEEALSKVDGTADEALKKQINDLAEDLKETKEEFRQLASLRINACKEQKIVEMLKEPFEKGKVKKAE